jgi:hypothetical protein
VKSRKKEEKGKKEAKIEIKYANVKDWRMIRL